MRWEEVHVKWCWMEKVDLGAEIVVEESMNLYEESTVTVELYEESMATVECFEVLIFGLK